MKKLIVWSGGYDSTALLISEGFWGSKEFDTCYCMLPNNNNQQQRELKARRIILKTLLSKYPNNKFGKDMEYSYVCNLDNNFSKNIILSQPFVWATTLMWNINISEYDEVIMGYIKNDCFWHVRYEIEQMIEFGIKALTRKAKSFEFKYPLEWASKRYIYDSVYSKEGLSKLLHNIEICENNHNTSCSFQQINVFRVKHI